MKQMTAERYLVSCGRNGRAVILYHSDPDEFGRAEPRLWLCRLGNGIVAVDDVGPNDDAEPDEGFLESISPDATIADIRAQWKAHRDSILAKRRLERDKASVVAGKAPRKRGYLRAVLKAVS